MSINIIVGSDEDDLIKLTNTLGLLKFLYNWSDKEFNLSFQDQSLSKSDIDDLIDWYGSMLDILTNPNFSSESV